MVDRSAAFLLRTWATPAPDAPVHDARTERVIETLQERLLEGALRRADRRCGSWPESASAWARSLLRRLSPRTSGVPVPARGRRVPGDAGAGAVRYRVRGRDPGGRLASGAALETYDRELRGVLRSLRDPVSGTLLVAEVLDGAPADERRHVDDAPDLRVTWRREAVLELVRHDAMGLVRPGWGGIPPLDR